VGAFKRQLNLLMNVKMILAMSERIEKRTKWLHIRLTEKEHEKIQKKYAKTTCKKLSDFARKVLLDKAVTVNIRNQSLDDVMTELIALKEELNAIGNNYNQMVKRLHSLNHVSEIKSWLQLHESARKILINKMDEIKVKIYSINDQWLQS
jgi:predicted SPOUT superfamily RNA methylase MTH1